MKFGTLLPPRDSTFKMRVERAGTVMERDGGGVAKVRLVRMRAIPNSTVLKITNHAWDAMVTTCDGVKTLVRRRANPTPGGCPLLGYEVVQTVEKTR